MNIQDLAERLDKISKGTELPTTPNELLFLRVYQGCIGNKIEIASVATLRNLATKLEDESTWAELGMIIANLTRELKKDKLNELIAESMDDSGQIH